MISFLLHKTSQCPTKDPPASSTFAIVTGASRGLGQDISIELASRGFNLILVARSKDKLDQLSIELGDQYNVDIVTYAVDLTDPQACSKLWADISSNTTRVHNIGILVNNAGCPSHGLFQHTCLSQVQKVNALNISALADLTSLVLPTLIERGQGYILNVASIAGINPNPREAIYGATKAYVRSFSQALNFELRYTGVSVTTLSPGPVRTGFQAAMGDDESLVFKMPFLCESKQVAFEAINAMFARELEYTPGLLWRAIAKVSPLMPTVFIEAVVFVLWGSSVFHPFSHSIYSHKQQTPSHIHDDRKQA